MPDIELITRYNYDDFIMTKVEQWMRFDSSPKLGVRTPDFPLWDLDKKEVSLLSILSQNLYTIVEFGSFT